MKTTIVIEEGKVTVDIDDGKTSVESGKIHFDKYTPPPTLKDLGFSPIAKDPIKQNTLEVPFTEGDGTKTVKVIPAPKGDENPIAAPAKSTPPKDKPERLCTICGNPITTGGNRAKTCSKPYCKQEAKRRYVEQYFAKKKGIPAPIYNDASKPPLDTSDWKPVPSFPPEIPTGSIQQTPEGDGVFRDPWDCAVCRNAKSLCTLHETLTNEGKRPPIGG